MEFSVDDYVYINRKDKQQCARINSILKPSSGSAFEIEFVIVFKTKDLPSGPRPYHGVSEIIESNEYIAYIFGNTRDIELVHFEVEDLDTYVKRDTFPDNIFYCRKIEYYDKVLDRIINDISNRQETLHRLSIQDYLNNETPSKNDTIKKSQEDPSNHISDEDIANDSDSWMNRGISKKRKKPTSLVIGEGTMKTKSLSVNRAKRLSLTSTSLNNFTSWDYSVNEEDNSNEVKQELPRRLMNIKDYFERPPKRQSINLANSIGSDDSLGDFVADDDEEIEHYQDDHSQTDSDSISFIDEYDKSDSDENIDFGVYEKHTLFNIYVQYMTSSLMDDQFAVGLETKRDNYFFLAIRDIRRNILDMKELVVSSSVWSKDFRNDINRFPKFVGVYTGGGDPCEVCNKQNRHSSYEVILSGIPYDSSKFWKGDRSQIWETETENENVVYRSGKWCHFRSKLYHRLQHYPFHLAMKIKEKIEMMKQTQSSKIIDDILDDKNWLAKRYNEFRSLKKQTEDFLLDLKKQENDSKALNDV